MKLSRKQFDILLFALLAVWLVATDRVFKSWAAQNLQMGSIAHDLGPIALTLGAQQRRGVSAWVRAAACSSSRWRPSSSSPSWSRTVLAKRDAHTRDRLAAGSSPPAASATGSISCLTTGYVVDFIQFTFVDSPVFNIADMCITSSGVVLLFVTMFSHIHADEKEIKASARREGRQHGRHAGEAQVGKGQGRGCTSCGQPDAEDAEWEAHAAAYEAKFESAGMPETPRRTTRPGKSPLSRGARHDGTGKRIGTRSRPILMSSRPTSRARAWTCSSPTWASRIDRLALFRRAPHRIGAYSPERPAPPRKSASCSPETRST